MSRRPTGAKPRLLFAWELGANYGHATNLVEVIREIGDKAHVLVAAKDPVTFRRIAPGLDVDLLPAPVAEQKPPGPDDLGRSYSDDLRHCGWSDPLELAALTESWGALIRLAKPDLIVGQAAPTALLAARGMDVKTAVFGSGYDCPPPTTPMPAFFYWTERANEGLAEKEARVVDTANRALLATGRPPLEAFADILRDAVLFLSSFPEIEAYAPRARFHDREPEYYGRTATTDVGLAPEWRAGAKHRVFAYVRGANPPGRAAVEACAALPPEWDAIVVAPGLDAAAQREFARPHLRILTEPARLDAVLQDCDVGVGHGSNGVASVYVAAGIPQVCLPLHAEQVMCARAVATHGLALGLVGRYGAKEIGEAIQRAVDLPDLKTKAEAVAARLRQADLLRPGERIAKGLFGLV